MRELTYASEMVPKLKLGRWNLMYIAYIFNVCYTVRNSSKHVHLTLFKSIFVTLITAYGGSALVSVLLAEPAQIVKNNELVPMTVIACYLMYFKDVLFSFIHLFRFFTVPIMSFFSGFVQVTTIVHCGIEGGKRVGNGGLLHLVFFGTVAGCGGSILTSCVSVYNRVWKWKSHNELTRPRGNVLSCILLSTLFVYMTEGKVMFDLFNGFAKYWNCVPHLPHLVVPVDLFPLVTDKSMCVTLLSLLAGFLMTVNHLGHICCDGSDLDVDCFLTANQVKWDAETVTESVSNTVTETKSATKKVKEAPAKSRKTPVKRKLTPKKPVKSPKVETPPVPTRRSTRLMNKSN